MKLRLIFCVAIIVAAAAGVFAQDYRISKSYVHNNLSIFLIHGGDKYDKNNILTLGEALENKEFVVYETSDVNELMVQNLSKTHDVFIQSGDIVKGGKQDRVLAVSIIVAARSGKIRIQAFCVESGRWEQRGGEDSGKFSSSNERIVSKELKLAANKSKSQREVWSEVSKAQDKLSTVVGTTVNDEKSESSLQLSLENKKVRATIEQYLDKLSDITDGKKDVIGYAFAINGKINSADIYVSNSLFKKLWPRMLKAAAIEAVAKMNEKSYTTVTRENVSAFLADSRKGKTSEQTVSGNSKVVTRESKDNVVFEAVDSVRKIVVHANYVKID
ncbi:MAG: hypothetical protein OEM82_12445 [Acidobacteriota bacterium]|nr:hypothetical protein [Acidobacteriota bacterium]MDH3529820.1 hypothetical protein [Acidobacteriota bacterium]